MHAENIYVSSSEELTDACSNASSGDVIYISSSTYNGPFVVSNKSNLTITSYNGEVAIEGSGSVSLIEIYNLSGITINNLVLRNNIGNDSEGIKIHGNGDGINITNCEIYNIVWTSDKTTMPTSSNSAHAIVMVGSESKMYSLGGTMFTIVLKAFSNDSCVFLAAIRSLNDSYQFYLVFGKKSSTSVLLLKIQILEYAGILRFEFLIRLEFELFVPNT